MKKGLIIFSSISGVIVLLIALLLYLYLFGINQILNSNFCIKEIKNIAKTTLDMDLIIEKPHLKTYLTPKIDFSILYLSLSKKDVQLIEMSDFDVSFNFGEILRKRIKLNKLKASNLVLKIDKLLESVNMEQNDQVPFDWRVDIYDADLKLDFLDASFKQKNGSSVQIYMRDITVDDDGITKTLGFNSYMSVSKRNKEYFEVVSSTLDEIKIYNDLIKIDNLRVLVNDSRLNLNASIDTKNVKFEAISDIFYLKDVFDIVNSDLVIENGSTMLLPLINPSGNVNFKVYSTNGDLSGNVYVNGTKAEIKDVTKIPITITKGDIKIDKDKIEFVDLIGFWGKNKSNKLDIKGTIKDYYKTFDSNVEVETKVTNEFFKNYLAPLIANTVLYASKPIETKIIYKAKNNIMDILWLARVEKGVQFGSKDSPGDITNYKRVVKGDFHIDGENVDIRDIEYYMTPDNVTIKEHKIEPIFVISGKMNIYGILKEASFAFARQMPSEILNIFIGQELFKKGTIKGKAKVVFNNNIPHLDADMNLEKTLIPSQRMYIKNADIKTDKNHIKIISSGGFKRARFDFNALIKNELTLPIDIQKLVLDVDSVDVKKFMESMNSQGQEQKTVEINSQNDIPDDNFMFNTGLVKIDNAQFSLKQGTFGELKFGNIKADMSLDENGKFKLKSNRFDIADGHSGLKCDCDFKNLKYNVKLGVKDIDSNLMAKVLFNLDKEITGKASGLMDLSTDKTMKLNGNIKFKINEGTIGKIGLVEYIMKIASLFRNPLVMINPAIVMDIISVPEGKFDKIEGSLSMKDNVIRNIDIKSYSKSLSALIRGRFDMNRHDASIRVYTRFSNKKKSAFGFLRNISLNTLANKIKMNTVNDANYYSMELRDLPQIDVDDDKTQVFLTQIEGDIENNNFLSSLKKIK